jgi:hypothetical protein
LELHNIRRKNARKCSQAKTTTSSSITKLEIRFKSSLKLAAEVVTTSQLRLAKLLLLE